MKLVYNPTLVRFDAYDVQPRSPFHETRRLKDLGFQFESSSALWWTRDIYAVRKSRAEMTPGTLKIIESFVLVIAATKKLPIPEPIVVERAVRRSRPEKGAAPAIDTTRDDVCSALRNLGYGRQDSDAAVKRAKGEAFEGILKDALAVLRKPDAKVTA